MAGGIVDPALRQREFAPARARFFIHAVQRNRSLHGAQSAHIHAGQLVGTIRMFQKYFAGIFKCFHPRIDRQTQQRAASGCGM